MKNEINIEKIQNYIKENNLSKSKFCELCKIGSNTLDRILNNKNFKITALFKIARQMNIYIKDLFIPDSKNTLNTKNN